MKKICIVIPYFGKWPAWFGFYLKSCEFNSSVNWLIYTDCGIPRNAPKNIRFVNGSLEDFSKLASRKIGFQINLKYSYKVCDFKPAYGLIFEDYLKEFDFWGHSDIDVIYGNIKKFITNEMLLEDEVISTYKEYLAGPFTLFRNSKKINSLFKKNPDYKFVFQNQRHYSFCECNFLCRELVEGKFVEKRRLRNCNMTWLIKDLAEKDFIKAYFGSLDKIRSFKKKIKICFDRGKLINMYSKEELLYFHFPCFKILYEFLISKRKNIPDRFYMTNSDFFYNKKSAKIKRIVGSVKQLKKPINDFIGLTGSFLKNNSPRLYYYLKKQVKGY